MIKMGLTELRFGAPRRRATRLPLFARPSGTSTFTPLAGYPASRNRFAMARAARRGRLTLSDDRGRVVAEASSEQHDATLVGNLPLYSSRTLYGRWGDWFAWLDLIILAVCLVMSFLPARETAASPTASAG